MFFASSKSLVLCLFFFNIFYLCGQAFSEPQQGNSNSVLDIHHSAFKKYIISASALKVQLSQDTKNVLVDIRPRSQFEKCRIGGSINIPLYSIKTKGFLKNRHVVIVPNGYKLLTPLMECSRLETQGFKNIQILYGGIQAWVNIGGKVEGKPNSISAFYYMPALDIFEERQSNDWIVLDFTSNPFTTKRLFPQWKALYIGKPHKSPSTLIAYIKQKIVPLDNGQRRFLAVLNEPAKRGQKNVLAALTQLNINNFFITDVTPKKFKAFLKQQTRIAEAKNHLNIKRQRMREMGGRGRCGCGL